MANEQNLTHKLTREDRVKAGKKSGEVRRKNKTLKELANKILDNDASDAQKETFKKLGFSEDEDFNLAFAMLIKQMQKALNGDTKSAEFIRDTAGQKPKYEIESEVEAVNIICDIPKPKKRK